MKPLPTIGLVIAAAGACLTVSPAPSQAQFTKRLGQAVQSNAENRAIQKVVDHENKAIDAALSAKLTSADNSAGEGMYGSLKADGRVTLDGVSFKEGTATFTDGSAAELKAIGSMLKSHGDVKLRIEAYADDKAVAVARAEAVRDELVKAYGIDTGRLQPEGYKKAGEQRVELVRL